MHTTSVWLCTDSCRVTPQPLQTVSWRLDCDLQTFCVRILRKDVLLTRFLFCFSVQPQKAAQFRAMDEWLLAVTLSVLFSVNPPRPRPAPSLLPLLLLSFLTAKSLLSFISLPFFFLSTLELWIPLGWCWCEQLSPQWQTLEIKLGPCFRPGPSKGGRLPFSLSLSVSLPFSFLFF